MNFGFYFSIEYTKHVTLKSVVSKEVLREKYHNMKICRENLEKFEIPSQICTKMLRKSEKNPQKVSKTEEDKVTLQYGFYIPLVTESSVVGLPLSVLILDSIFNFMRVDSTQKEILMR
jgi:hypothetical protein